MSRHRIGLVRLVLMLSDGMRAVAVLSPCPARQMAVRRPSAPTSATTTCRQARLAQGPCHQRNGTVLLHEYLYPVHYDCGTKLVCHVQEQVLLSSDDEDEPPSGGFATGGEPASGASEEPNDGTPGGAGARHAGGAGPHGRAGGGSPAETPGGGGRLRPQALAAAASEVIDLSGVDDIFVGVGGGSVAAPSGNGNSGVSIGTDALLRPLPPASPALSPRTPPVAAPLQPTHQQTAAAAAPPVALLQPQAASRSPAAPSVASTAQPQPHSHPGHLPAWRSMLLNTHALRPEPYPRGTPARSTSPPAANAAAPRPAAANAGAPCQAEVAQPAGMTVGAARSEALALTRRRTKQTARKSTLGSAGRIRGNQTARRSIAAPAVGGGSAFGEPRGAGTPPRAEEPAVRSEGTFEAVVSSPFICFLCLGLL